MSDNKNKDIATAEQTADQNSKPEQTKPAAKQAPAAKAKMSKLALLSLLLSSAALAGGAYLWQQMQQPQTEISAQINAIKQQVAEQQQNVSEFKQAIEQQQQISQQKQAALNDAINDLSLALQAQQKKTEDISSFERSDWSLAEAEYLMKLASQSLLMAKEIEGATQLLQAADDILREFDDAALHSVRKTLIADITALKSAARYDIEGVYLRLDAISQQIEQLELFKAPQLKIATAEETLPEQTQDWQQRLQTSFEQAKQKLSQYIQIKRRDEVYKPMLAPEKEAAIRQSIRLMIEQAQLALLSGNQALYDISLKKSSQWVNDYFAIDEQKVAQFNQLLEELQRIKVKAEMPDISGSSKALRLYIETLHELPSKKSSASDKPAANNAQGDEQA